MQRATKIFIPFCLFVTSFGGLYIPSSLFATPIFFFKKKLMTRTEVFLMFYSCALIVISIVIAQSFSLNLIKSFIILLSIPLALMTGRLINRYLSSKRSEIFTPFTDLLLSFILLSSILFSELSYEPSNISRVMLLASIILPIRKVFSEKYRTPNILLFQASYLVALFYTLSTGSLTIIASTLLFASLASIGMITRYIFSLFYHFRIQKKQINLLILLLLLFSIWLLLQFNLYTIFLDDRRERNFQAIMNLLQDLNLNMFFSLSGGRFLSSYEGYASFILYPFDISELGQDLPSIHSGSYYYGGLLSYSNLGNEFLLSRRPNSFVSWLVFNFRFLSIPFLVILIHKFLLVSRSILFKKNYELFIGLFSLLTIAYFVCIASPPSFSAPWILVGLLYDRCKLRTLDSSGFKVISSANI